MIHFPQINGILATDHKNSVDQSQAIYVCAVDLMAGFL